MGTVIKICADADMVAYTCVFFSGRNAKGCPSGVQELGISDSWNSHYLAAIIVEISMIVASLQQGSKGTKGCEEVPLRESALSSCMMRLNRNLFTVRVRRIYYCFSNRRVIYGPGIPFSKYSILPPPRRKAVVKSSSTTRHSRLRNARLILLPSSSI